MKVAGGAPRLPSPISSPPKTLKISPLPFPACFFFNQAFSLGDIGLWAPCAPPVALCPARPPFIRMFLYPCAWGCGDARLSCCGIFISLPRSASPPLYLTKRVHCFLFITPDSQGRSEPSPGEVAVQLSSTPEDQEGRLHTADNTTSQAHGSPWHLPGATQSEMPERRICETRPQQCNFRSTRRPFTWESQACPMKDQTVTIFGFVDQTTLDASSSTLPPSRGQPRTIQTPKPPAVSSTLPQNFLPWLK